MENTMVLREGLEKMGRFDIVSKEVGVPLVAFSLKDCSKHTVFEIAESLRKFGWIIPAYTMPPDAVHVAVLRVVIREDFSRSLAERLISDIKRVLGELDALPSRTTTIAHVTAEKHAGETVLKKSILETGQEIATYWRRLVEHKTNGVC